MGSTEMSVLLVETPQRRRLHVVIGSVVCAGAYALAMLAFRNLILA